MPEGPLLSIIITSYTVERLPGLMELLDSIRKQTYSNIETIFVAEGSPELCHRVGQYGEAQGLPAFRVLFNDGEPGASAARNLGIRSARGEIVAFTDDDAVLFPDWGEQMVATYQDDTIVGVTGPALPLWQDKPVGWLPEEFYWLIGCTSWADWRGLTEVRNVWLQNASFRREAFHLAGLINTALGPRDSTQGFKGREFKEGVVSEEIELSLRVRRATQRRLVYNPQVRVRHKIDAKRLRLSYITRWSYWMGYSKSKIRRLYPQAMPGADSLSQERQLLRRILFHRLPRIFQGFFRQPLAAWRQLSLTVVVLFFVALGYFAHSLASGWARLRGGKGS